MKLFKSLSRFCTNISQTTSLTRYRYFSEIQAKQLMTKPNQLREMMLEHIQRFGEMSIERYWKLALTDPQHGYYVNKNVFSKQGDFTTSPEISPLFGQMFGVWIVYFLKKTGIYNQQTQQITKKFRIVELGGGRGLFIRDIMRALFDLNVTNNLDLTFIEVSDFNRKAQQDSIMEHFKQKNHFFKFEHQISTPKAQYFSSQNPDKNVKLTWTETIQDLYQADIEMKKKGQQPPFTIFVMNEFMDALPVTVLRYTQKGWRQKILTKSIKQDTYFELKNSSRQLPQKMTPVAENPKQGQQIQISPTSLLTMDLLAKIISNNGGAIINVDYGDQGVFSDSIRAIKDHRYIPSPHFWQVPGQCDLSAYVNFKALAQFAEKNEGIIAYEALPQGYFLQAMGIVPRVDLLKKNMNEQNQKRIQSQYERLVLPSQMGEIYKVQIITKKQYGEIYPHIQIDQYSF